MLIEQKVTIIIVGCNRKKYEEILEKNLLLGSSIEIDIKHLTKAASNVVIIKCDYCNNTFNKKYYEYIESVKRSVCKKDSCKECSKYKRFESNIIKYGSNMPLNKKENIINNKRKSTMLAKYGVEYLTENIEQYKKIIYDIYGVDNISKLDYIKEKKKITCNINYGSDYYLQSKEGKQNMITVCNERYGCDNPTQNEDIFIKAQKNSFKKFKFENTELIYQSKYELDFLNFCVKNNIIVENGKVIDYVINNKKHKYFSDFYIPKYNIIIEIKSSWTMNVEKEINEYKKEAVLKNNYNFLFVLDKNYNELKKLINIL